MQQLLDKALGKVLFVDEAYRPAEGHFAKEAMDDLVDCATKERYHKKLIIVLAGYEADINRLMAVNPGLTSRFPDVINFRALAAEECSQLLLELLRRQKSSLESRGVKLDLSALEAPRTEFATAMRSRFTALAAQDSWANARDVGTLARAIFSTLIRAKDDVARRRLVVSEGAVLDRLRGMAEERGNRAGQVMDPILAHHKTALDGGRAAPQTDVALLTRQVQDMCTTVETSQADPAAETEREEDEDNDYDLVARPEESQDSQDSRPAAQRDAGVSDAVWEQLQQDRRAEKQREEEYKSLVETGQKASSEARERIVKRLLEEDARRRWVAEMRRKLEVSGACPVGYAWIRQSAGFRCAGGSHFISDEQVAGL